MKIYKLTNNAGDIILVKKYRTIDEEQSFGLVVFRPRDFIKDIKGDHFSLIHGVYSVSFCYYKDLSGVKQIEFKNKKLFNLLYK